MAYNVKTRSVDSASKKTAIHAGFIGCGWTVHDNDASLGGTSIVYKSQGVGASQLPHYVARVHHKSIWRRNLLLLFLPS